MWNERYRISARHRGDVASSSNRLFFLRRLHVYKLNITGMRIDQTSPILNFRFDGFRHCIPGVREVERGGGGTGWKRCNSVIA